MLVGWGKVKLMAKAWEGWVLDSGGWRGRWVPFCVKVFDSFEDAVAGLNDWNAGHVTGSTSAGWLELA